jgi:hypothetical protein
MLSTYFFQLRDRNGTKVSKVCNEIMKNKLQICERHPFIRVKGCLLACDMYPFSTRKTVFYK